MLLKRSAILLVISSLLILACFGKDLRNKVDTFEEAMEGFDKIMKESCIETAGEEKGRKLFKTYKESFGDLRKCVTDNFDKDELTEDFEKAAEEEKFTPFFHKYCTKRSPVLSCIDTFNGKISGCFDEDEQEVLAVLRRLLNAILNFVCEKDGENVLSFINDNGAECIKTKSSDIEQCFETNFGDIIPDDDEESVEIPDLDLSSEECNKVKSFKTCVYDALGKCEDKSASTFVESLFNHLKKEFDYCAKYDKN